MMKMRIKRRNIDNKYLSFTFRVILGAIFIYASYDKILDPAGFAMAIDDYRIVRNCLLIYRQYLSPGWSLFALCY